MSRILDFTIYLTPDARELEQKYIGNAMRTVSENLCRYFDTEPRFEFYDVPDHVEHAVMNTEPFPDMEQLYLHYAHHLTNDGIVCVLLGRQYLDDCGVASMNKSTIVVTPEAPSLGQTILHELGHCCGAVHVKDCASIMFPFSGGRTEDASWDDLSKEIVSRGLWKHTLEYVHH
ncbi:hypothetical protein GOV10_03390 [Candidatus Woesearchaeota archaeon]|nr:hypothetical protein [Candidatus Woesearchaeota archaeon]